MLLLQFGLISNKIPFSSQSLSLLEISVPIVDVLEHWNSIFYAWQQIN